MLEIRATNLAKRFGRRRVFSDINIELTVGDSLAVVGPNGSGKSTLLAILLGLLRPTKGKVEYFLDGKILDEQEARRRVALVAPYLNLYDQLSAEENLKFFATVSGNCITGKRIEELLTSVGLQRRGADLVSAYSSGMKQRLKYAVALLNEPEVLFLDEPTSSLDDQGKKLVGEIIESHRSKCIIVLATNEREEYDLGTSQCRLN